MSCKPHGSVCNRLSHSSRVEKRCCRSFKLCSTLQKVVVPGTAGSSLTLRPTWKSDDPRYSGQLFNTSTDKVKKEEKASCFTLLRRITRLKCVNSKVRSNVECCSLDRDSPKGSCHLVEPTWGTHLYRKAFRILDLECNVRAKTNQNNTMKQMSMYIYNTVDIDRIDQQR